MPTKVNAVSLDGAREAEFPKATVVLVGNLTKLLAVAERIAHHFCGHVHNLDHFLVRHSHRPNDAQSSYDLTIYFIRRSHDGKLLVRDDLALTANVDSHALGAAGNIQKLHELRLLLK